MEVVAQKENPRQLSQPVGLETPMGRWNEYDLQACVLQQILLDSLQQEEIVIY